MKKFRFSWNCDEKNSDFLGIVKNVGNNHIMEMVNLDDQELDYTDQDIVDNATRFQVMDVNQRMTQKHISFKTEILLKF